ncbi:MAG TPA: DEAD/DEAH box helicase family protein [Bryobacteraceae bacterium]|jgi:type III restriction enzyme|nr:DEAD/DEAH box helicase family protein [Bryobacteraceae bacterium]
MPDVVIENPIINSPFEEPMRHFYFGETGITDKIVESRRNSAYFVPIPPSRKKSGKEQLVLGTEWTKDRQQENKFINDIRNTVAKWRFGGYDGVTSTTRALLEYWQRPDRERKLFFCQIEALETAIYFAELSTRRDSWIRTELKAANDMANPLLNRVAFKMATGTGKTVVMAMIIAWQALNKFTDSFLIVTPGITIRDRLRVLLPNEPGNYYRALDVVPEDMRRELEKAKILITNYHAFQMHEKGDASSNTKELLGAKQSGAFKETPDEMVRRVCRAFTKRKGGLLVINDEAHHCYRPRVVDDPQQKLIGEDRKEAEASNQRASLWISGLEAVKKKLGVQAVYDLSATPFFLNGSGYRANELFPWVVSDFSLIDAIESGIVKIPRVPVSDNNMIGDQPTYRDLWLRIRDELPKKRAKDATHNAEPRLPTALQGALESLYSNYKLYYAKWAANAEATAKGQPPPVFIVVCNNTSVSKMVFDYIAGWEKDMGEGHKVAVSGALPLFSNAHDGKWTTRPNTILVDSVQLESGEAMSDDFRRAAAVEIEEFKAEYRERYPERDVDALTPEDLLREVLNTVGKPGKLGEQIKCVVSVSMLTEGWDANTVTHILGVRAFGTQLLCEQVVGRGLRRMSFALDDNGRFFPEYAEVYGVPFSFIPSAGSNPDPRPPKDFTRVRGLPERADAEMRFPRVMGYKYDLPPEKLQYKFDADSRLVLSTKTVPTETLNAPIVGATSLHTLDDLKARRVSEVDFKLARHVLETHLRDDTADPGAAIKSWLFPQVLEIARAWRKECVACQDDMFPQILLWAQYGAEAGEKIYRSIAAGLQGEKRIKPILFPYDVEGTTRYVDFDTARPTYATDARFSQISHVVADTESWEQKLAQSIESMEAKYFKNDLHVGFTIPYTFEGAQRRYVPDFVMQWNDLNLILEVTGEKKPDKEAKVSTTRNLWVPAINNDGRFGKWAYLEIRDPWNAKTEMREFLETYRNGN